MAWVRPKHPKRKEPVDPTEALRPMLEYFSCRPSAPNPNSKALIRLPKKPLLIPDTYKPPKSHQSHHHEEEPEQYYEPSNHHQQRTAGNRSVSDHHSRHDFQQRVDHESVDYHDRASYHERASQRPASHYTAEPSPPPPPPPVSSKPSARPGAHLRLMPSRHRIASDTYIPRRPASRWASATTPLEM